MPTVWIPAPMRDLTDGKESISVPGKTVRQAIMQLDSQFPGMKDRLCDGNKLRPGISVAVDAQMAPLGLIQAVTENSEIHFIPAIGGG